MALKCIEALQEPNMNMHHVFSPTGQVTNAAIIPAPSNMFLPDSRPAIPLPRFSRHLNNSEQAEGAGAGGLCLRLSANCQVLCMVSFTCDSSEKSKQIILFHKLLLIYREGMWNISHNCQASGKSKIKKATLNNIPLN